MHVRVGGSRPSVLLIMTSYLRPSIPTRRRSTDDQRLSILFIFTTRKFRGQISQNCRAPADFSLRKLTSLAAAAGTPKCESSSLSSLQTSISLTRTIRLVVTKSLLDALPPNPANIVFGRTLRQGELTSKSQPSNGFRISSPDFVTRPSHSEYTFPRPWRSPVRTTGRWSFVASMLRHQWQCRNGGVQGGAMSCVFRQAIQHWR